MKTMNPYNPDHPLQNAYNKLHGGCLCGHFESCSNCDGSLEPAREAIEQTAEAIGYQLYLSSFWAESPSPILPLAERKPWKYKKDFVKEFTQDSRIVEMNLTTGEDYVRMIDRIIDME